MGDILRGVYNSLAQDPNSLSNLDQDLPNFIQDQVPIYSLPQEWLWCESWCSMESKEKAKTIDLCNNPLHKVGWREHGVRNRNPSWIWQSEWFPDLCLRVTGWRWMKIFTLSKNLCWRREVVDGLCSLVRSNEQCRNETIGVMLCYSGLFVYFSQLTIRLENVVYTYISIKEYCSQRRSFSIPS